MIATAPTGPCTYAAAWHDWHPYWIDTGSGRDHVACWKCEACGAVVKQKPAMPPRTRTIAVDVATMWKPV